MAISENQNHDFPLNQASQWTANYRAANPNLIKAHAFGKNAIKKIFQQAGCVGMRIYYALDENGVQQLIIVGVDANANDLHQGLIAERSMPCPPLCGANNPLNS